MECLSAGILFADVACAPVDRLPEEGHLVPAEHIQLGLGGCASNTALALSRLGIRVGVSGCVGEDTFGHFIVRALGEGGVDTSGIHRVSGIGSACTMIINVKGQDRRFISTAGANMRFTVSHIPPGWVREARVFYVGGYFMMPGLETAEMVDLFRTARQAGAITVLDVVLYGRPESMKILEPLLAETDVFLPNDHEAEVITGLKDPVEQAERFRAAGVKTVVITCGERGSVLVSDGLRLRAGVYPTEFVGGAGSGDAFDAGYIAGLLAGEDPVGCLRWGSALGASCVRAIGTTESIFTRPEAEAFLREHELEMERI
ncbi:MAG TPA: carbohydrate kinase family protein [Planctomycetaceae bacterium]|nr:carbohydrate kinase family protein [Planctomycetaceae bacterium]HIQ22240.1 carbohydrate kinase family protein [Planctomycetota bacterium]